MPATLMKKSPAKKRPAKAAKKTITKKSSAKKTTKSPSKKVSKKLAPARKKAPAKGSPSKSKSSSQNHGIKVRDVVTSMDPKIKLTDDAVELLNALLTAKFTQIAEKAVDIVHRGKQENMGCEEVKKAVNQVFIEKFQGGAK